MTVEEVALVNAARDLVDYLEVEGAANLDVALRAIADSVDDWRAATAGPAEVELLRVTRGVRGFVADMRAQGIHVGVGTGHAATCATCREPWPCPFARTLV